MKGVFFLFLIGLFLSSYNLKPNEKIELRGFLFQDKDGKWFLSEEPDLKSCCVGANNKIQKQVLLSGNFESQSSNQAVTIIGKAILDPLTGQLYLENPSLVPNKKIPFTSLIIISSAIIFLFLLFLRKRRSL
jgi:hypothetical protein